MLAHGGLAATGGAAQQHGQPVAHAGGKEALDVAVIVELQHLGIVALFGLTARAPFVPARGLVALADRRQRRDRRARPADGEAGGPVGHRRRKADLQPLAPRELGRTERAPWPDILSSQRTGQDRDVFQIVVIEVELVAGEHAFLADEGLAGLVDRHLLGGRVFEPGQDRLEQKTKLRRGFTRHLPSPSRLGCPPAGRRACQ
jgi:hypothetical protein